MSTAPAKAFVLIQLCALFLSCSTVVLCDELDMGSVAQPPSHHAHIYPPAEAPKHPGGHHQGHHHHHHHTAQPPVHPPVKPPTHPPVHPPVKPPTHPPVHPPVKPPTHPPVHPPVKPPTHPPVHPPVKPPTHPPVHPPIHPPSHGLPPRSFVGVQGVVYCKPCKYVGVDTLLGASPLVGAVVKLQCNNTKYPIVQEGKTDKNGYFFIMAPKTITTYGSHKCRASLVSSPLVSCSKATNLHDGVKGAILMPQKQPPVPAPGPHPLPFQMFSVGPFAFEPPTKVGCKP